MIVKRLSDPGAFLEDAGALLLEDEARHNLMLGIGGTLRDHPSIYREFGLWLVEDGDRVVGAALQTPPFNLVVALPEAEEVASALADALDAEGVELPGLTGAVPEVDTFARAWEERSGMRRRRRLGQRIYKLTTLQSPEGVGGASRLATDGDRPLLLSWVQAFSEEGLNDTPPPVSNVSRIIDTRLREGAGGFLLWENPEPVSLAGWGGLTPNGVRIGPVYTPPEHRRRGYGSAVTAAVTADRLAAGRRFCFLYTDLANPTSNRIYMNIGYEPVCDSIDYAFEPA
jgi:GNAT superfamily N-acetyltransferase